ncbi:hypothetical protein [Desulfovibrio litoralis]|uniref:Uncharacterized protein n=1 Tax=Desulfovibrio litoralis DSM 11393 TaxID=1121455 RepID=A0A1M7SGJ8_9BACT|nr:hypothetical protein [Desulfovibrio litoralis]SHN57613.1 hypothetical protein SAMN02745728_00926 [Desulfovibrio litoralis DSM 11393]
MSSEKNSVCYASTAYHPGNVNSMPCATNKFYTYKEATKDHNFLPWGHYLNREPASMLEYRPLEQPFSCLNKLSFSVHMWHIDNEILYYKLPNPLLLAFYAFSLQTIGAIIYIFWLGMSPFTANGFVALILTIGFLGLVFYVLHKYLSFPSRVIFNRLNGTITVKRAFLPDKTTIFIYTDALFKKPTRQHSFYNGGCVSRYITPSLTISFICPAANTGIVYLHWQFLQRFMDVSQPLPDIPYLESFRHLDPTTVEHDKTTNRPERYWRDKTPEEISAMAKKLAETEENITPIWPCTLAPFIEGRDPNNPEIHY